MYYEDISGNVEYLAYMKLIIKMSNPTAICHFANVNCQ